MDEDDIWDITIKSPKIREMEKAERSPVQCCVICPACGEEVTPKQVKRIARQGNIMSFYSIEYDCPKCGMERIWGK
jgi:predicted RNA-binding Zn-ribbon protein involved in translation (DUF1610 family)